MYVCVSISYSIVNVSILLYIHTYIIVLCMCMMYPLCVYPLVIACSLLARLCLLCVLYHSLCLSSSEQRKSLTSHYLSTIGQFYCSFITFVFYNPFNTIIIFFIVRHTFQSYLLYLFTVFNYYIILLGLHINLYRIITPV